jgi:hypothetical protein
LDFLFFSFVFLYWDFLLGYSFVPTHSPMDEHSDKEMFSLHPKGCIPSIRLLTFTLVVLMLIYRFLHFTVVPHFTFKTNSHFQTYILVVRGFNLCPWRWSIITYLKKYVWKIYFLSHFHLLFKHLFTSLWTHEYLFYTLNFSSLLFYLLCFSIFYSSFHKELFNLLYILHTRMYVLSSVPFCITIRCWTLPLHVFLSGLKISKDPCFFLLENGARKYDLGANCGNCY